MHELSLCQAMLAIINQHVTVKTCKCIKKIALEIGQLAAIDKAAFLFAFSVVAKGTVAEHATIEITNIVGQAHCNNCQKTVTLEQYYQACPHCGNFSLSITQGEELRLKFLELEQ